MSKFIRLATMHIEHETDVVTCRQSAKHIAAWLGFPAIDQIRIATAVSELARNIYQYVGKGEFHFDIAHDSAGKLNGLRFQALDHGPGIDNVERIFDGTYISPTGMGVGLAGAQKLLDEFSLQTDATGTQIHGIKYLYPERDAPDLTARQQLRAQLPQAEHADPYIELEVRGTELLLTTSALQEKQRELEAINVELENTNKGVVALYLELEKAAQEMQKLAESKSRFFSNMTHEFRTPLNIIDNISRLLLTGIDGELNAEQLKQVEFINMAAAELSELVEELLTLAEADSGRMEIVPNPFSLEEFMAQVRQFTSALAMRYPQISWSIAPLPHNSYLNTDRSRLFQLLRNLISNAFKYTPSGYVKIQVFEPDDHTVEFLIEDSGVGISEADQARIFEEFARLRNPATGTVQGNGLGLPLAQRLAQLLKGNISLTSTLGKGSRFFAKISREYEPLDPAITITHLNGISILIIDDTEADRYLLRRLLQPLGAVVVEAKNGVESLNVLHTIRPDVIFLDLDLPDISGTDLLDMMDWSFHDRVVVYTAKTLTSGEQSLLASRCRAIVNKSQPDVAEAILLRVQQVAGELENAN